jgi:Beta-lactamase enzyme family
LRRLALISLLAASLVVAEEANAKSLEGRDLVNAASIASARRYAESRSGLVAFAVYDDEGRVSGLRSSLLFPSASVVKAMLLVAELRQIGDGHLSEYEKSLLAPMIEVSDNEAAEAVFGQVGVSGLMRLAHAAGMTHFSVPHLFDARISAADQARFFLHLEEHVPTAHRAYALKLLSSVASYQRWGIAKVADRRNLKIYFKGGWRSGIFHQVALIERGGRRVAVAILTSGESMEYGAETQEGIAQRLLR